MTIQEFLKDYQDKKIKNTKIDEHAVSNYIKTTLQVKEYIPFKEKKEIAESIAAKNIKFIDGIKKHDAINQYLDFIVAMLQAHTNLEFGEDVMFDYDTLAASGLLPLIIAEFQTSYNESDILLKMAVASELEDNNINVLIGRFLNGVLYKLDTVTESIKDTMSNSSLGDIFGTNFTEEDLAALSGLIDRLK